eukprot:Clim_evm124s210 gene=Clim_evmTU124s210
MACHTSRARALKVRRMLHQLIQGQDDMGAASRCLKMTQTALGNDVFLHVLDHVYNSRDRLCRRGSTEPKGFDLEDRTVTLERSCKTKPWGMVLVDITDEYEETVVLVTHVFPDSPASKAGIRRGDTIIAIQGNTVVSREHTMNSLRETSQRGVLSMAVEVELRFDLLHSLLSNVDDQLRETASTDLNASGSEADLLLLKSRTSLNKLGLGASYDALHDMNELSSTKSELLYGKMTSATSAMTMSRSKFPSVLLPPVGGSHACLAISGYNVCGDSSTMTGQVFKVCYSCNPPPGSLTSGSANLLVPQPPLNRPVKSVNPCDVVCIRDGERESHWWTVARLWEAALNGAESPALTSAPSTPTQDVATVPEVTESKESDNGLHAFNAKEIDTVPTKVTLPDALERRRSSRPKSLRSSRRSRSSFRGRRSTSSIKSSGPPPTHKRSSSDELNAASGSRISRTHSPMLRRTSSPRISRSSSPRISRTSSPRVSHTSSPWISRTSSPRISRSSSPRISRCSSPRISRTSSPMFNAGTDTVNDASTRISRDMDSGVVIDDEEFVILSQRSLQTYSDALLDRLNGSKLSLVNVGHLEQEERNTEVGASIGLTFDLVHHSMLQYRRGMSSLGTSSKPECHTYIPGRMVVIPKAVKPPVVIVGFMADDVLEELFASFPDTYRAVKPCTSRKPRPEEEQNPSAARYNFVNSREMHSAKDAGKLLDVGALNGAMYGIRVEDIKGPSLSRTTGKTGKPFPVLTALSHKGAKRLALEVAPAIIVFLNVNGAKLQDTLVEVDTSDGALSGSPLLTANPSADSLERLEEGLLSLPQIEAQYASLANAVVDIEVDETLLHGKALTAAAGKVHQTVQRIYQYGEVFVMD